MWPAEPADPPCQVCEQCDCDVEYRDSGTWRWIGRDWVQCDPCNGWEEE